ncbi:hypothetical protein BHE90_013953 [Fusarium euwallaceae]|uniref:Uncharacterized protein n=1 Tax=Fusarium euwallaceae TaxID=1147111 RepID=A0A430L7C0_9HYPO|nr:hypothetical protein BHE90_013953 [Fusarium euwallaceae]
MSKYQHHDWLTRDLARIIWVQNPELAKWPLIWGIIIMLAFFSARAPARKPRDFQSKTPDREATGTRIPTRASVSEFQAHVHVRFQIARKRVAKTPKWRLHFTCIGSPPSTPPCSFAAPQDPYHRILIGCDTHAHLLQTRQGF